MVVAEITCMVTLHGIGFQQPPCEGLPGYADNLHAFLCAELNRDGQKLLSDDPSPEKRALPESLPVYVQSIWPVPGAGAKQIQSSWEAGLRRLGSWKEGCWNVKGAYRTVEVTREARLVENGCRLAHVALVYSGLESNGPEVVPSLEAAAMVAAYGQRYSSIGGQLSMIFQDLIKPHLAFYWADLWPDCELDGNGTSPSLRVRQDAGDPYHKPAAPRAAQEYTSPLALLRTLENDVAAYVCQNEHRQRVRSFVREALLRLACREDIASIVLNTHSNGTVVALDVMQELPPFAAKKIRALITAGSPLRKYVDLFAWGRYMTMVPPLASWHNFWDAADIVADPLRPNPGWRRYQHGKLASHIPAGEGIYQILQPDGSLAPLPLRDIEVNNVLHSPPGGLRAHNYWDNRHDVIPCLARVLRYIVTTGQAPLDL